MPNQHGPVSQAGKNVSCMNHLQHGSTANSLFIKDEDPQEFFALLENAFEQYQPAFNHEAALITRKNDYRTSIEGDFMEIARFDRYKTAAARTYERSLKNLQTIQKMARDEQRWQHQLACEKQKLAIHVERFELLKQKTAAKQEAAKEALPDLPFVIPPFGEPSCPSIQQTIYIGLEDDDVTTVIYEVTPSNDQIRCMASADDKITRTYNFVGAVPTEYQHLITPDAITWGASTSVKKLYSFEEWRSLANRE